MSAAVMLEREGPIAWITLNRPDAMNAINMDVREALPRHLRDANADDEVRVVVLRGAGERAFCVGADIKEFAPVDSLAQSRQARVHESWIAPFDEARKPIVASIHGYCLGGGLEVALACDIRIAARGATFAFPETGLGVMTGVGGSQRLQRIVGLGMALDIILTGQRIESQRAYDIGLVSRLVEPDTLAEETRAMAEAIAAKAPLATAFAKEAMKKGQDLDLAAGLRLEADLLTLLLNTDDRQEGARAFREKRSPVYRGR